MKKIQNKIVMILLGVGVIVALSACGGDGEHGAHSDQYLLDGVTTTDDTPVNTPPVADAGVDQTVPTGSVVTLDGSASTDADEDRLTYTWMMRERPEGSEATLSDSTAPKPTFTADKDGVYDFTLVVHDGIDESPADTVRVTATTSNTVPVADAGSDRNIFLGNYTYGSREAGESEDSMGRKIVAAAEETLSERVTVELDGSGSHDDGKIASLSYSWKLVHSDTGMVPDMDSNTSIKPKVTVTCETAFGEIDGCTRTDVNLTCSYLYTLTVYDGEFRDEDNVTLTAVYARSCFPE